MAPSRAPGHADLGSWLEAGRPTLPLGPQIPAPPPRVPGRLFTLTGRACTFALVPEQGTQRSSSFEICLVRLVTTPLPHWLMLIPVSSDFLAGWGEAPSWTESPFSRHGGVSLCPTAPRRCRLPSAWQGRTRCSGPVAPRDRSRRVIARSPINHRGGRRVGIL